ncbi:hypothetical protein ACU4GA_20800 [Methylobacterium oryzae CBMB20]
MANRMILTLIALAAAAPASAQTFRSADPYAPVAYAPGYGGDPGFANAFVHGTYIGAPLTACRDRPRSCPARGATAPTVFRR